MADAEEHQCQDKDDRHIRYPETQHFDYFRKDFLKGVHESYCLDLFGTVKIHGTNIALVFTNTDAPCQIQSRNRILSSESDAYHCYKTLSQIPLKQLVEQISKIHASPWTDIMVVGEWAGKGVQKGVGISEIDPKILVIFNIRIDQKWGDIRKYRDVAIRNHRIYNICDFPTYSITIDLKDLKDVERADKEMESLVAVIDKKCPVAAYFGIDGPGEGIVYTYINSEPSQHLYNFKVKGEAHQIVKKPKFMQPRDLSLMEAVAAFVEYCIVPARLDQGISYLEEMGKPVDSKSTGIYIRWVVSDALKEEGHTLEERNLKEKDVEQALTSAVRKGWVVRLKAALREDF
jgi:hypothetical protein